MQTLFILAVGAVLGAFTRFFFTHISSQLSMHYGFPYGTLAVNVLGSLFVGYVLSSTGDRFMDDKWRIFLATGFCGAFTTFSAFAFESASYLREGRATMFLINFALNNMLCLLAVFGGVRLAKSTF